MCEWRWICWWPCGDGRWFRKQSPCYNEFLCSGKQPTETPEFDIFDVRVGLNLEPDLRWSRCDLCSLRDTCRILTDIWEISPIAEDDEEEAGSSSLVRRDDCKDAENEPVGIGFDEAGAPVIGSHQSSAQITPFPAFDPVQQPRIVQPGVDDHSSTLELMDDVRMEQTPKALPQTVVKEVKSEAKSSPMMDFLSSDPFNWADEVEEEEEKTRREVKVKSRGKTTYGGGSASVDEAPRYGGLTHESLERVNQTLEVFSIQSLGRETEVGLEEERAEEERRSRSADL